MEACAQGGWQSRTEGHEMQSKASRARRAESAAACSRLTLKVLFTRFLSTSPASCLNLSST